MLHVADSLLIPLLKLKLFWSFQPQDVSMNNEVHHLLHSESVLWWKKKNTRHFSDLHFQMLTRCNRLHIYV